MLCLNHIRKRYILQISFLLLFSIQYGCNSSDSENLDEAIKKSARYLTNSIQPDGMFEYRINMDSSVRLKNKYNILRHSGTIYALTMYHELNPNEEVYSTIIKAGRYLQKESISPLPDHENMLAIWSKPKVNGSGKPLQAKLGGTGIGLVALLSIEKTSPGFTELTDLRALGNFIIYMQKEDGSFYSKYIPSLGGRQDKWNSLYYPGEAALGLLMLYEIDPSLIWLKTASKALEYLAINRKNSHNIPADHWALLATEKILSLELDKDMPVSRTLLINHAIQICESMLKDQVKNSGNSKLIGGFTRDGKTTPTSTRLEGLLASLNFLPKDHEIIEKINLAIPEGILFLLNAQVKDGTFAGAIPRSVTSKQGTSATDKKFNKRVTEVRIDYIQHALSAMIQYENISDKFD